MNKLFISLVIACFGTATASAQYVLPSTQMALTNEEQATPVTTSLGGSTDFSTTDATTLETPATWNTTTTAEPPRGRPKRYAPRRSFSPRIAALAELGVGGDFDINATLGAQLFHFFYLGGGLNMTYWYDNFNSDFNRTDVNFVINPRFEIPHSFHRDTLHRLQDGTFSQSQPQHLLELGHGCTNQAFCRGFSPTQCKTLEIITFTTKEIFLIVSTTTTATELSPFASV